jgi:hypothetical protein
MVAGLLRWLRCRNFCGDIDSTTDDFEASDAEMAEGSFRARYAALVDAEYLSDAPGSRGSPGDRARKRARARRGELSGNSPSECPLGEEVIVRVQSRDPQLTHDVVLFIARMGFAARALADQEIEVDVPNDVPEHSARLELDLYLSLWRVITERYSVELLC